MGSDDASFAQGQQPPTKDLGSAPESAVMPVARKSSGTFASSPRERLERVALSLLEHTLHAYRCAEVARDDGDEPGAEALREAGNRGQELCVSVLDEIAGLA